MSFDNIKPLIYVLVAATPAFFIGQRIAYPIYSPREFSFLRNAWIIVTISAFFLSNFFFFAAVLVALCFSARASGAATPQLFVVLVFAVPAVPVEIGGFGLVNTLLDITPERILSLALLLPVLLKGRASRKVIRNFATSDRFIVVYVLLLAVLDYRLGSVTNMLRTAVIHTLDILIPYFVMSRRVTTLAEFQKVCLAFVTITLLLSPVAAVELIKRWHIYYGVSSSWGRPVFYGQEGFLRASASALGPIIFGFLVMVAMGCLLAVQKKVASKQFKNLAWVCLTGGIVVSLSRGPWVGAAVLMIAYVATGTGWFAIPSKLSIYGIVALLTVVAVAPNAIRLSDIMPFARIRADTIDYRQQLLEQAMIVIERNPIFGSTDYRDTPELQEMMQGQHIIDIVNHYVKVALDSGVVGLTLFAGFFISILLGLGRVLKSTGVRDGDLVTTVRGAKATLVAIMVTIATVSSIDFIPYIYWSFAGLCVALVRIANRERVVALKTGYASPATLGQALDPST